MDHILNEVLRLCCTKHVCFWRGHIYGRQRIKRYLTWWILMTQELRVYESVKTMNCFNLQLSDFIISARLCYKVTTVTVL